MAGEEIAAPETPTDLLVVHEASPGTMTAEVEAAVRWWVAVLLAIKRTVTLEAALADLDLAGIPADEPEIAAFDRLLRERLPAHLAAHGWGDALAAGDPDLRGSQRLLRVEYEPQGFLWEVAEAAGLPWSRWPGDWRDDTRAWPGKTTMIVSPRRVVVKAGRAASYEPVLLIGQWRLESYTGGEPSRLYPEGSRWWDHGWHDSEAGALEALARARAFNEKAVASYGSHPDLLYRLTAPDGTVTAPWRAEGATDEEIAAALATPLR